MKKHNVISFIIGAVILAAVTSQAQTNAPATWTGAGQFLWDNTLGSSNMVYAPFFGRKLTGDADEIGLAGFYNFNNYVAAGGGIVRQWQPSGVHAPDTYQLQLSLQLKDTIRPFQTFGVTNFAFTVWGSTAIGTPFKGSNSGNLMNASCVGAVIQIWQWTAGKNVITLDVDGFYQNQSGSGYYDGNWIAGGPAGGLNVPPTPAAVSVGISF